MTLRRPILAMLAAAATLTAVSAEAQYYDYRPYGRPPPPYGYEAPPPPPPPPYGYGAPPRPYGYVRPDYGYETPRPYRVRRFGQFCQTSRGACETQPLPLGTGCRCYIDGFGEKRGIVQ